MNKSNTFLFLNGRCSSAVLSFCPLVRSIDICALKEYTYSYESGKLMRAAEYAISVNDSEMVTARTLTASILYSYDSEDNVTCKRVLPVGGAAQITYFESTDDNTVVKFTAGGKTVTAHSKTDSFGRKEFDELQLGGGFLSRQFRYLDGEFTDEHAASDKLKSSPTTQLVSEIRFADGRTISYEYDEEDRIVSVTDSLEGVTAYTYDALGQLLTETKNNQLINEMAYVNAIGEGNYGNIVSKNGVMYQYDSVWKDLLTQVGDQTITYDAQGNPTQYLGHTLAWEKGRQLKSFDSNIQFAYNANGIRTSKTVNGTKHEYLLDGTKILRESWGENILTPLYDNEDSVCGIEYNGTAYFFVKNLQGDVIAIANSSGDVVARYTYDAWGACTITQDNPHTIARLNPFRYRGYYYDAEIGLYYLQSRYYDPMVGRFINADYMEFILAVDIAMRYNVFVYCSNNPLNKIDKKGTDAVWLQAPERVGGFGHSALLFKHPDGWYYWSWGRGTLSSIGYYVSYVINLVSLIPLPIALSNILATPVNASAQLICTNKDITKDMTSKNYSDKALPEANRIYKETTGNNGPYKKAFYIKGSFKSAYKFFKTLEKLRIYSLLLNNCMQTIIDGLLKGTFTNYNKKRKRPCDTRD